MTDDPASHGVPAGYEPSDDPSYFEFNPRGYVRSPEEQAVVEAALRSLREGPELGPPVQPAGPLPPYALPIGMLTEDEERLRDE